MARILTGIQSTGNPHLGNLLGAIIPAINLSKKEENESLFFIADLHSFTTIRDAELLKNNTFATAAAWIAFGFDTDKNLFYRQSDVTEVTELTWYLNCFAPFQRLQLAHSFKDKQDRLSCVNNGLFSYPVLMAADILLYDAEVVPVGKDQIQHLEMARDIGGRFNHIFGELFTLPEVVVGKNTATLAGLDGRKMSKSYNNTIPLFLEEKKFRKLVNKIKTNSLEPGEPKDPEGCTLFGIYRAFATDKEVEQVRQYYADGIAWGEMKKLLFTYLNDHLKEARERYEELMQSPDYIEDKLEEGAAKARAFSTPLLGEVRQAVGISRIQG